MIWCYALKIQLLRTLRAMLVVILTEDSEIGPG